MQVLAEQAIMSRAETQGRRGKNRGWLYPSLRLRVSAREDLVPAEGRAGKSVVCCPWLCLRDLGVSVVNICTTKPIWRPWRVGRGPEDGDKGVVQTNPIPAPVGWDMGGTPMLRGTTR